MKSLDELLRTSGVVVRRADDERTDVRRIFLHAGEVWAGKEPTEITTILGSCVAVCVWDPVSGIGGMNHFMLPSDIGANFNTPRYATFATTTLLEKLRGAGADPSRLKAKIFGGARILGVKGEAQYDLGHRNVEAAKERMREARIPVVEEQTGGAHGLKLIYESSTGRTVVIRVSHGES